MNHDDEINLTKALIYMGFIPDKELVYSLYAIMEADWNWDPYDYKEWLEESMKCS